MKCRSVFAGHFKRLGGEVDGGDLGQGKMSGQSQRDGSCPCANVENTYSPVGGQSLKNCLDQVLGLRPRNERGRGDFELEAEELLLAGNVLDRLVVEAAADGRLIKFKLLLGEQARRVGKQGSAIQFENV